MSHSLPLRVLYCGRDEPLPEPVQLQAGPFSMIFAAGDLRYVKLGGREVIRCIYAAVRDRNWGTIIGQIEDLKLDVRADSFQITYHSNHKEQEIHFVWHAEITGAAGGAIRFAFDGQPKTTFQFRGGQVVVSHSSKPLAVECLVLRKNNRSRILLANPTLKPQVAGIVGLSGTAQLRLLDETNAVDAMTEPEEYRATQDAVRKPAPGAFEVELKPCALARVDVLK